MSWQWDFDYIPLLSKKRFEEMQPDEFKKHVIGLYSKPQPKISFAKKNLKPFSWRINKKGTLCLRVNRKPKWLTEAEVAMLSQESGVEVAAIMKKIKKDIEVRSENQKSD